MKVFKFIECFDLIYNKNLKYLEKFQIRGKSKFIQNVGKITKIYLVIVGVLDN